MLTPLDQVTESTLETDVCIAGAGPAGITLALQLSKLGFQVVLLEAGGLSPPVPEEKSLYEGSSSGRNYPLNSSRLRYFGGTSGHWGGWCRPLDDIDFIPKPHIPYSGWPINRTDLDPWYPRAHEWLEIPTAEYFQDRPPPFTNKLLPEMHGVTTHFFRFSPPTRYGTRYRDSIEKSPNIQCLLGANVTDLIENDGLVSAVTARSLRGKEIGVKARCTVLATGGIENARILLNSSEHSENALGNKGDWLGRGFMDHPGWAPGILVANANLNYHKFVQDGVPVMPVMGLTKETLINEQLISCCALLHPVGFDDGIQRDYFSNPWFKNMAQDKEPDTYRMQLIFEPSPCRDSRVQLTSRLDKLGLRKLDLHWAINDSDYTMLAKSIDHFVSFFGQSGMGRVRLLELIDKARKNATFTNGMHHMGTTRMSEDPANGVVDSNCRVHGVENLFVAGSSVFPSVGFSNPTLTIIALACRLADHLNNVLTES